MTRAGRALARFERRTWTLAVIAAAGLTLLVSGALALLGPPELLDWAVSLGNARLLLGLCALFAVSCLSMRIGLRRRRLREEEVDEEPPRHRAPAREHAADAPAGGARAHLR